MVLLCLIVPKSCLMDLRSFLMVLLSAPPEQGHSSPPDCAPPVCVCVCVCVCVEEEE